MENLNFFFQSYQLEIIQILQYRNEWFKRHFVFAKCNKYEQFQSWFFTTIQRFFFFSSVQRDSLSENWKIQWRFLRSEMKFVLFCFWWLVELALHNFCSFFESHWKYNILLFIEVIFQKCWLFSTTKCFWNQHIQNFTNFVKRSI